MTILSRGLIQLNSENALQGSLSTETDDALQQFINTFNTLKAHFHGRVNVDIWKVARSIQDGMVHFASSNDRLVAIGKFIIKSY